MNNLFSDFAPEEDDSPLELIDIVATYIYYSQQEDKEFKRMAKLAMKKHYPDSYREANLSDLILKLLRETLAIETHHVGRPSCEPTEDIPQ